MIKLKIMKEDNLKLYKFHILNKYFIKKLPLIKDL